MELKQLHKRLQQLESDLEKAYIIYAKRIDGFSKQEMKPIDAYSDEIIEIKKAIRKEERRNEQ